MQKMCFEYDNATHNVQTVKKGLDSVHLKYIWSQDLEHFYINVSYFSF